MEMGYTIAEWLGWGDGFTSLAGRMDHYLIRALCLFCQSLEIENVQATAPITIGTVALILMQHIISCLLIPRE